MSARFVRSRGLACLVGLFAIIASGDAVAQASAFDVYRARADELLAREVVPKLAAAAAVSGAPLRTVVRTTASRDPFQIETERAADGALHLFLPAGLFVFVDSLVDAEILARSSGRRDLVQRYYDDIVGFAGEATRPQTTVQNPGRFFRRLGWDESTYGAEFASADYQQQRVNITVQAIAWLVAHRLTMAAGSVDRSADRRAAVWASRAGYAPLPNPGVAMLYFAALEPNQTNTLAWRCRTRRAIETGLDVFTELRASRTALPYTITDGFISGWREIAAQAGPADRACRANPHVPEAKTGDDRRPH